MLVRALKIKVLSRGAMALATMPSMKSRTPATSLNTRVALAKLLIVCLVVESATADPLRGSVLLFGGGTRDDPVVHHFSQNFPPSIVINYNLGFSFWTCSNEGNLLNQVEGSDRLSFELINEDGGTLRVNLTTSGSERSGKVGRGLAIGQLHEVNLRFLQLDSTIGLYVRLDAEPWTKIGQLSDGLGASPLLRRSAGDTRRRSLVLGGNGFVGCLLEGPSLRWIDLANISTGYYEALKFAPDRLARTCPFSKSSCQ